MLRLQRLMSPARMDREMAVCLTTHAIREKVLLLHTVPNHMIVSALSSNGLRNSWDLGVVYLGGLAN
eukprot:2269827-Amphidinium_carterae.1